MFRLLNEKNMQARILYPARLSFGMDGEIKSFQDRQKLKKICDHQASPTRNIKGGSIKVKKTPRVIQYRNLQSIETKTSQAT